MNSNERQRISCFFHSEDIPAGRRLLPLKGVLVAIAIPVFTSQLEKSRDAVSISNIRVAYAQAQAAYLTGTGDTDVTVTKSGSAISTIKVANVVTKGTVASDTFSGLNAELPFATLLTTEPAAGTHTLTFTYDANGAITKVAFDAT